MAERKITMTESELMAMVAGMVEAKLAEAPATKKIELTEEQKAIEAHARELVDFKAPKTKTQRDDVFIGLNGVRYTIKRGVTVKVPRAVKMIYEESEEQDAIAADLVDAAAAQLEEMMH